MYFTFSSFQTSSSSPSKQGKKNKQKKTVISTGVISVVSGLAKKNTPDGKRSARNKVEK